MGEIDLRTRLALSGEPIWAAWMTLGAPLAVEAVGHDGWDLVLIDQQHGQPGGDALVASLQAASAVPVPAMVRIARNDEGLVLHALDAGAQGVMAPMINSVADAEALVCAVKYPPKGVRSFSPYRAGFVAGTRDIGALNDWTIACGQIETKEALGNLDAILAVDGLDMICVGPNDLSISMSNGAVRDVRHEGVLTALPEIVSACKAAGVWSWVFANDADYARDRVAEGWDIVTVGTDTGWLTSGGAAMKTAAGA